MLPAILADLPVFQLPPRSRPENSATHPDVDFGPDASVDLAQARERGSDSGAHSPPGAGLYGPNGRFVEGAAPRDLQDRPDALDREPREQLDDAREFRTADAPVERRSVTDGEESVAEDLRELSLTEFDVAMPPAEREELKALADRIDRRATVERLEREDYLRIADLMEKLGRFDEAQRARTQAEELTESRVNADEAGHNKQAADLVGAHS